MKFGSGYFGFLSTISNASRSASNSVCRSSTIAMVCTVPPDGGRIHYRLSRWAVAGTSIVAPGALLSLTFSWVNCHGARRTMLCSLFEQRRYHDCGVLGGFSVSPISIRCGGHISIRYAISLSGGGIRGQCSLNFCNLTTTIEEHWLLVK